jgi:hypothetical protein
MSTSDPTAMPPSGAPGAAGAQAQPSEEELRAAYEAELSRITSAELMLQAAVSLLNVGSYRLAPRAPAPGPGSPGDPAQSAAPQPPSAGDLEQARDAIDAVRALLEIIERRMPNETAPLRNALSQLQMVYAREAQAAGAAPAGAGGSDPGQGGGPPPAGGGEGGGSGGAQGPGDAPGEQPSGPGPAESSGRLWVPGR